MVIMFIIASRVRPKRLRKMRQVLATQESSLSGLFFHNDSYRTNLLDIILLITDHLDIYKRGGYDDCTGVLRL